MYDEYYIASLADFLGTASWGYTATLRWRLLIRDGSWFFMRDHARMCPPELRLWLQSQSLWGQWHLKSGDVLQCRFKVLVKYAYKGHSHTAAYHICGIREFINSSARLVSNDPHILAICIRNECMLKLFISGEEMYRVVYAAQFSLWNQFESMAWTISRHLLHSLFSCNVWNHRRWN